MNTVKHLVCDKEIITLEAFKLAYNLNDLQMYKKICNSRKSKVINMGEFEFKVIFKKEKIQNSTISKSGNLNKYNKVPDMQKYLKAAIPPLKETKKGMPRYLPFIYDNVVKRKRRETGETYIVVNNVAVSMEELAEYLNIELITVKTRFYGVDSLTINNFPLEVIKVRDPMYFEIFWKNTSKIRSIRGVQTLRDALKKNLTPKEIDLMWEEIKEGRIFFEYKKFKLEVKG